MRLLTSVAVALLATPAFGQWGSSDPEPGSAAAMVGEWSCKAGNLSDPSVDDFTVLLSYRDDGTANVTYSITILDGGTRFTTTGTGTMDWELAGDTLSDTLRTFRFTELVLDGQRIDFATLPADIQAGFDEGMEDEIGRPNISTVELLTATELRIRESDGATLTCLRG